MAVSSLIVGLWWMISPIVLVVGFVVLAKLAAQLAVEVAALTSATAKLDRVAVLTDETGRALAGLQRDLTTTSTGVGESRC